MAEDDLLQSKHVDSKIRTEWMVTYMLLITLNICMYVCSIFSELFILFLTSMLLLGYKVGCRFHMMRPHYW
jgi:hypothetical protein